MRFDVVLNAFYALSSLVGSNPQVCRSHVYALPSVDETKPSPGDTGTAFVNVNVVPMDAERVLEKQTVLIERGRITAVGPSDKVKIPAGVVRIDGRGKYLMPGLGDMHEHSASRYFTEDPLFRFLAIGVTNVRYLDFGSPALKQKIAAEVPGPTPRLYVGLRMSKFADESPPRVDSVGARLAAYKAMGYDFIQSDQLPSKGTFADSVLLLAAQVGFPVASHNKGATVEVNLPLGAYRGSAEHVAAYVRDFSAYLRGGAKAEEEVPLSEIQALAQAIRRAGFWNSLTLNCEAHWPSAAPTTKSVKIELQLVKAMADAGARLLLSSDAGGGSTHDELAAMVDVAGLSPYQALLAGTRNVAEYFRLLDSAGTVAVGKRADLVLLYGNPLQNVHHAREPAGVMLAGQWLDRVALDQRLFAPPSQVWKPKRPEPWPVSVLGRAVRSPTGKEHVTQFVALTDSLELVTSKPVEYARVLRLLADELGSIRASLTPQQRVVFDPAARVWLREQARQGYPMSIVGVIPTP